MGNKKEKTGEIKEENAIIKMFKSINERYFSYTSRVIISVLLFVLLFGLSFIFFSKTLKVEKEKIIRYQDMGTLDYKVYLKQNQFYETSYLEKNMNYIASLIKNIDVDLNYQFTIDEPSDMKFTYDVIGNLSIYEEEANKLLYEKEYSLKSGEEVTITDKSVYNINDSISIDYDHYNALANSFKATFGVNANSQLTIYVRVNKTVSDESNNIDINDTKQMSLTIPLTQKTLEISINDTGVNSSNNIINESHITLGNIIFGVLGAITFILSVASLLKSLELLIVLKPKKSKYDKYIGKILNEYDRLIVETPTEPRLENKEIIKIKKFEELLDARDNLKRPIMYYSITNHQKCYFYIEKENVIYLLTVKAVDLEG